MIFSAAIAAAFIGQSMALSGTVVVLNKAENTASIIRARDGKTIRTLPTGHGPNEVMVSPSGRVAVISNMGNQTPDKTLTVVRLPAGEIAKTIDLGDWGRPHGIAFLSEQSIVITSHAQDALVTVDLESGKIGPTIKTSERGTHMVVLSPDKKRAYASNAFTGTVTVADLVTSKVLASIACGERAEGIAISPDGKTLTCGNVGANTVSVIDAESMKVTHTLSGTMSPIRTIWTKDGRHVVVSCAGSGELAVFDPQTWKEVKRVKLSEQAVKFELGGQPHPIPMNFAVHPDGRHIFVVMVASSAIAVLDTQTWEVRQRIDTGKVPDGIAWSPVEID